MINLHISYSRYYDSVRERGHPPSFDLNVVMDTVEAARVILEKYMIGYDVKAYSIIKSDGTMEVDWCL